MRNAWACTWSWLAVVPALVAGCAEAKKGSPAQGQIIGSTYTNHYFHFTVPIPSGWSVGEIKPILPPPAAGAAGAAAAQADAHQLLMVSEKPLKGGAESNASLLVMAEKASTVPGVKTARDYVARVNQLMVDAPIAYHPITPITETPLGNTRAQRLDFTARLGPAKTARQTYLACLREGYVVSFILSASDEAGLRRLEQLTQSIRFR